jgi:hypothetical protein
LTDGVSLKPVVDPTFVVPSGVCAGVARESSGCRRHDVKREWT